MKVNLHRFVAVMTAPRADYPQTEWTTAKAKRDMHRERQRIEQQTGVRILQDGTIQHPTEAA